MPLKANMPDRNVPSKEKRLRSSGVVYSSKIIKAGALLADTKTLLAHWDVADSAQANMERIRRENLFGKASRSRVEDVLAIFRQRFLGEESVTRALVVLVQNRLPTPALDRILYFHAARADRLLHDTVTEILTPLQARGITQIDALEIQQPLKKWVDAGKTSGEWSEPTILRIAQGLLSTLRDFGVLQGAVRKRIAPAYLPVAAFAYLAFYFKQHQPSGAKLVELPDWKLFFLSREGVERAGRDGCDLMVPHLLGNGRCCDGNNSVDKEFVSLHPPRHPPGTNTATARKCHSTARRTTVW